jgi:hypothetical protein
VKKKKKKKKNKKGHMNLCNDKMDREKINCQLRIGQKK